jgi:alpha-tubulin suppressor-like RCC1 family protein
MGQLGDGTTTDRARPRPVGGGRAWRQVSGGYSSTCGVSTEKVAFCWGQDDHGQLGDGPEKARRLVPSAVAGSYRFIQIDAGYNNACGVTTGRRAYCWGWGPFGVNGDGKFLTRFSPSAVSGSLAVRRVSVGGNDACAETLDSRTYCWGYNSEGELGVGAPSGVLPRPNEVVGHHLFVQVSVGGLHACGVTANGTAYCWGDNRFGQLGDNSTSNRYSPTEVTGSP